MAEKIIALVDGSIYSASVCEHAAWVSSRNGAAVEVLHILGRREAPETSDLSGSIRLGARTALLEELATLDEKRAKLVSQRGRAILDDARAILEKGGVSDITTRLRYGDVVETLAEQEKEASLILVGKRGEAADFAKGHLGSNLERIVRASHRPVLVAARAFRPIKKLLIAFDGGASALKALDHVTRDPVFVGTEVHVAMVGAVSVEVQASLDRATEKLRDAGFEPQIHLLRGQAEMVLAQLVESATFDLVVMGAYGHSRIRSLIIGSTTTAMIRACKVPVLLMR